MGSESSCFCVERKKSGSGDWRIVDWSFTFLDAEALKARWATNNPDVKFRIRRYIPEFGKVAE